MGLLDPVSTVIGADARHLLLAGCCLLRPTASGRLLPTSTGRFGSTSAGRDLQRSANPKPQPRAKRVDRVRVSAQRPLLPGRARSSFRAREKVSQRSGSSPAALQRGGMNNAGQ
ncbi:hypothetical protein FQZ97_1183140 [compost metagenome]